MRRIMLGDELKEHVKEQEKRSSMTKEEFRNEAENFILYWTSCEKEREQMRATLDDYLNDCFEGDGDE